MGEEKKPLILVTNDDGVYAKGIQSLIRIAQKLGDVVVVAPNQASSGMSHAITVKTPLYLTKIEEREGTPIYKSNGTPVDCVKLAVNKLLDRKPDLVLSGINHGSNSSVSLHYSGTVGAAREGALNGIPSIALSLLNHSANADFSAVVDYCEVLLAKLMKNLPDSKTYLNINFPDTGEFKGVQVCRQTKGKWIEEFIERQDPRGGTYYWLSGHYENYEPDAEDTDEWALNNGYVSILPCHIDVSDTKIIDSLKKSLDEL